MSLDYYTCHECGHNFPDCGDYTPCGNYRCSVKWCTDSCADRYGQQFCRWNEAAATWETVDKYREDDDEDLYATVCKSCARTGATDEQLFAFALKHFDITRDELEARYLAR